MKKPSATLLPLVAFLLLMSFVDLSVSQGMLKYCRKEMTFTGGCPARGSFQCVLDVLGSLGAGSMPKNCLCKAAGGRGKKKHHTCDCMIVC